MIPPSRIDDLEREIQPNQWINPELIRETLVELVRSVNELEQRIEQLKWLER